MYDPEDDEDEDEQEDVQWASEVVANLSESLQALTNAADSLNPDENDDMHFLRLKTRRILNKYLTILEKDSKKY